MKSVTELHEPLSFAWMPPLWLTASDKHGMNGVPARLYEVDDHFLQQRVFELCLGLPASRPNVFAVPLKMIGGEYGLHAATSAEGRGTS